MQNKNLTIHVANTSVMALYLMEMEGQISDGKYENSRPFNHWHWVNDVKDVVVDKFSGISGENTYSRFGCGYKRYNINEWITYINGWRKGKDKYRNYGWATRVIAFGKFGRIYPDMTWETMTKLTEVRILLEEIQDLIETGDTNAEDIFSKITDFSTTPWREKYYEASKEYITPEFIQKYLDTKYDIKELKEDLRLLSNAVNEKYKVFMNYIG